MMPERRVLIPYRSEQKVQPYVAAAREAGMVPTALCVSEPMSLNGYDALILMGGTDVNPKLYGEEPQAQTDEPDEERDRLELAVLHEALERDKPILAICRGLQLLNVHHGGTLVQHLNLPKHDPELPNKADVAHEVAFEPDTRLSGIARASKWGVNSRHHQAIAKIGAHLRVAAREPEYGIIEALERPDKHFVIGVQWHPEDQIFDHPEHLKLFLSLAAA